MAFKTSAEGRTADGLREFGAFCEERVSSGAEDDGMAKGGEFN